jgi:pyrroline-5-carboxylate reductase
MGGAILAGLLDPSVNVNGGIRVTNRTAAKAEAITGVAVTSLSTEQEPDANRIAVRGAKIVLVGVKPGMVADVLAEVADALEPDAVIVSVAAGITIETMESVVPQAVVRAMPNTPSTIGRGVTGIAGGSRTTPGEVALVVRLFETVGSVIEVPENKINELGTISGSGPAYVFYFIEELTRTAVGMGFTEEQAAVMVNDTFLGAAELLASSDVPPAELRRRVTSPKGSTERAIAELEKADLKSLFDRATAAALARTEEMARGL